MTSNKFVIKCGNFAVLVDVHILPEGSNKDTSWFSDQEKEEVCMYLEEVVVSRIKRYLEARKKRGQWKSVEHASSAPLFITANNFHITAYFMKRWVNLRCALGKHYRELRMFPDKFVVCISKLEFNPSAWTCESGALKEVSNGTSEYFSESSENRKLQLSLNEQIKQDILKEIVKRTKRGKNSVSKPQTNKDSKKVDLGSVGLQTGNRKNDCQTSPSPQSEVKWRSTGWLKNCINTAESNLEFPVSELENNVNQRQAKDASSQQKPHSVERLKSRLLSKNSPCSYESALLGPKQNQKISETQSQQKSCSSEEKLNHFKEISSEETPFIPGNTERSKCSDDHLGLFLEEKTPLNSRLFSKQDFKKIASDENLLTFGTKQSQPLSMRTNQNEPDTTTEELPVVPSASYLEMQTVSSKKLIQKRKKEGEDGLRKLKLRRLKKP
ncbi:protein SLX4IP [Centrocercus urophasianus]|uniref:protein SLX4IP n=1 Tax=Centrocercus urophasianus TaxID=9002 RepID=UPI001C64FE4A|nr:protein SLX4IP [Centrocercus urophasianus]